jgi:ketosteroid isomerase-like protein
MRDDAKLRGEIGTRADQRRFSCRGTIRETSMNVQDRSAKTIPPEQLKAVERIYRDWDKALSENDVERLLAIYAPDATIESPLIPHLMGIKTGICRGRDQIRALLEKVAERKPAIRKYYRTGFFTDGEKLMWEYPRAAPEGEQIDFVEVMEIRDNLIQHHRVYWGWFGFNVLQEDRYH